MTAPAGATASAPLLPLVPLVPAVPGAPVAPFVPATPGAPATPFWFHLILFSVFLHFFLAETMRNAPAVLPFLTTQPLMVEPDGFVAAIAVPPTSATRHTVATMFGYVSLGLMMRT